MKISFSINKNQYLSAFFSLKSLAILIILR
nr:MAG TPA: hypothetical protein [Caudoviricetes sp.]